MNFNLNYNPPVSPLKVTHADKILMTGSCFSENIGEKFIGSKFNCLVNPNGILFNPLSIASALSAYMDPEKYKLHMGTNNGLHFSFDHHGSFSFSSKEELETEIKKSLANTHSFLKQAKFLIITFGSAFGYRLIENGSIVANCHKLPQQSFIKTLLNTDEIVSAYSKLINALKDFNPSLQIIFTVSPVKYLRDGVEENNLSKAILIQSVHHLIGATSNPKSTLLNYFPAYELITDDLRDYRFYKEDMAHPNAQAIDYVWEKFGNTYFDENTKKLNNRISDISNAIAHRPIHEGSEAHVQFKNNYLQKCEQLEKEFSSIDLSHEKQLLN